MRDPGSFRTDGKKVRTLRIEKGWSQERLADFGSVDVRAVRRAEAGEPIRPGSLNALAQALGVPPSELLHPSQRKPSSTDTVQAHRRNFHAWDEVRAVPPRQKASNGLEYEIYLMRDRYLDRFGRAKRYDLSNLSDAERSRIEHVLARHAKVCARFRGTPHIPLNYTAEPGDDDDCWWVIDEWTPGPTLEEALREGALDRKKLPRIMREIAEGLRVLHGVGVIRRELTPRSIILKDPDQTVILTDFELAKLLDGSPSIPKHWQEVGYRAPEADGPKIDFRADVYSWGRILVHAASGGLPEPDQEKEVLAKAGLPRRVLKIAEACVAMRAKDRPADIAGVIQAIRGWR